MLTASGREFRSPLRYAHYTTKHSAPGHNCSRTAVLSWCLTVQERISTVNFLLAVIADSSYHQLMSKPDELNTFNMATRTLEQAASSAVPAETITTAIHIPKPTWTLLRAVAFRRAQDQGGRASVSKLIAELVERHRKELERESK